jgi:phosphoribosylamine--glycine ligase
MKVLVLGSGGREHALVWKLRQSPTVEKVYCAPGSDGIAEDGVPLPDAPSISDPQAMVALAGRLGADLTVVGPEAPLVAGVVDEFTARGLAVAGPTAAAARLEGSKIFAKQFMARHKIPTAEFLVAEQASAAHAALDQFARWGFPVVLKADGLAAGKGVVLARDRGEADATIEAMFSGELVGEAGRRLVVERFLPGTEVSLLVLSDGRTWRPLPPCQDHKAVFDNDQGPNTGGMGAFCDDAILTDPLRLRIAREIVEPTLAGMAADGAPYSGVLYCGLMLTAEGPQVLEYNVRFGDPETQPIMMRMKSDLGAVMAAISQGSLGSLDLEWSPGAAACVVAASGGYPGSYAKGLPIRGLEQAAGIAGVKVFHAGTRRGSGGWETAGGRVLGVTARGASLTEALQGAYGAMGRISFPGMHFRRDIGRRAGTLVPDR